MTQTIMNRENLVEALQQCGWRKSAMFDYIFCKDGQYFEAFKNEECAYGIGHQVRCEMSYPICVINDYDPSEMVWYQTIKHNGITIRLGL